MKALLASMLLCCPVVFAQTAEPGTTAAPREDTTATSPAPDESNAGFGGSEQAPRVPEDSDQETQFREENRAATAEQLELLRQHVQALEQIRESIGQVQQQQSAQLEAAAQSQAQAVERLSAAEDARASLSQARATLPTGGDGAYELLAESLDRLSAVGDLNAPSMSVQEQQSLEGARVHIGRAMVALNRRGLDEATQSLILADGLLGRAR
jgi:hypothetical protein